MDWATASKVHSSLSGHFYRALDGIEMGQDTALQNHIRYLRRFYARYPLMIKCDFLFKDTFVYWTLQLLVPVMDREQYCSILKCYVLSTSMNKTMLEKIM